MNFYEKFRVLPGAKVDLAKIDAGFTGDHDSHESALPDVKKHGQEIRDLQYLMYAENRHSLLICLQGRDAAGKDGTINHVLSAMNPQGCSVTGFKVPTAVEAAHDFLWRCHKATPGKGHVSIFNRSHYEDVLVVRVHNLVPKSVWSKRFEQINNFETLLTDSGTHILKFYLHIDADEQLRRFKQRLDDPARHWKISEADYTERAYWNDYTSAFQDALSKCSPDHAPWFIIPSNHKWFRNLAISEIVSQTLKSLKMSFPKPAVDLEDIRKRYHQAADQKP